MSEAMDHPAATRVWGSAGLVMFLGFVVTIVVALVIAAPLVTGMAIAMLVGLLLIAAGILRVGFAEGPRASANQYYGTA